MNEVMLENSGYFKEPPMNPKDELCKELVAICAKAYGEDENFLDVANAILSWLSEQGYVRKGEVRLDRDIMDDILIIEGIMIKGVRDSIITSICQSTDKIIK